MNKSFHPAKSERGAVLVVGLIMLALITIMITSSFSMSNSNLKAVANTQFRNEAVAAANQAIEQVLSSPFTNAPAGEDIDIDINSDGAVDYVVRFSAPVCVSASQIAAASVPPSSTALGPAFTAPNPDYETVWDLNAVVTDAANSGSTVQVHQGVRVLLSESQYHAVCT